MNFYKINSRDKVKQVLDYLAKNLIENWDFTNPVQIEYKPYSNKLTKSQRSLMHIWFRDIASEYKRRGFTYENEHGEQVYMTEKCVKLMLKHKFLGVRDIRQGKLIIKDQLVSTEDLSVGEESHFLDEIYSWAYDHGVQLKIPEHSDYMKYKRSQNGY